METPPRLSPPQSGNAEPKPAPHEPEVSPSPELPANFEGMDLNAAESLFALDFASLPMAQWPDDSWEAVKQLEAALESVRHGVELQLQEIESDTCNLEELCEDMRMQVQGMSPEVEGLESMRSLLVCYFPREANKEMIRTAFARYGAIDSVYLVHKDGKPACYGFVNFADHPSAVAAMRAAANKEIVLVDKRNEKWCVKAEWTKSAEIPKKPKKKRSKKNAAQDYFGSPGREDFYDRMAGSPPLPLSPSQYAQYQQLYGYDWSMMGYMQKPHRGYPQQYGSPYKQSMPKNVRFDRPLSYQVAQPSSRPGQSHPGPGVAVA